MPIRRIRAASFMGALALLAPLALPPAASAQDAGEAGRTFLKAKELLRTGKVADRVEAIAKLIALDSAPAITCLEEAIQRSAAEMEKLSKEVDKVDEELSEAQWMVGYFRKNYPALVAEYQSKYLDAKRRWDVLAAVMRGHLDICINGSKSFASFRSPGAVDRIVRGAEASPSPLARQMYIQALGAPGKESRIPVLLGLLKSGETRVRAAALRSLRAFHPRREVFEAVHPLLKDRCWSVRMGAAQVVARMPQEFAVPALLECAERETGEPALQVDSLLRSITGVMGAGGVETWRAWWRKYEAAVRGGSWERPEETPVAEDPTKSVAAFFQIPIESDNLLLVMDLSGSMGEDMVADARTATLLEKHGYGKSRLAVALVHAYQMVEGLPPAARINILTFSDKVTRFSSRASPASTQVKKNVVNWLNTQKTGHMTNIWDALRQGFGDHMASGGAGRFEEVPDTIIFLTDGEATAGRFRDEASLCDLVELWNASAGAVIHCVGIGNDYDDSLLGKLSTATGGYFMDMRKSRLLGTRNRPEVLGPERCPAVPAMSRNACAAFEAGFPDERVQAVALLAAACTWSDEGLPVLGKALGDTEAEVAAAAAAGLASLGGGRGVPLLAAALSGDAPAGALAAAKALGGMGPAAAAAIPALEKAAAAEGELGAAAKAALASARAKPAGK